MGDDRRILATGGDSLFTPWLLRCEVILPFLLIGYRHDIAFAVAIVLALMNHWTTAVAKNTEGIWPRAFRLAAMSGMNLSVLLIGDVISIPTRVGDAEISVSRMIHSMVTLYLGLWAGLIICRSGCVILDALFSAWKAREKRTRRNLA